MAQLSLRQPNVHPTIIWLCLITGVVLFLAVMAFLRWKNPALGGRGLEPLVWVAIAVALAGFAASRALARLAPAPDVQKARTRMIVRSALCEPGALLGGVAWLLTGNAWSWLAAGLGVLGVVLVYPRSAPAEQSAPSRMIR